MRAMVHGIGINDADYEVEKRLPEGGRWRCAIFMTWYGMISRCYGGTSTQHFKTYDGVAVCDEWLRFSTFRSWMLRQDWLGKHLDKDIIRPGNKLYCPEACCFVPNEINALFKAPRRDLPVGVYAARKRFRVETCGGYHGLFQDITEADMVSRRVRAERLMKLASEQADNRVQDGMIAHALLLMEKLPC